MCPAAPGQNGGVEPLPYSTRVIIGYEWDFQELSSQSSALCLNIVWSVGGNSSVSSREKAAIERSGRDDLVLEYILHEMLTSKVHIL